MRILTTLTSLLTASLLSAGMTPHSAYAADAEVGIDFATAYVFRGAELNDSAVAQPYLELAGFPGIVEGLSIGTWGNFDLQDGAGGSPESGEFSEVDFYVSYDVPLCLDPLSLSIGYTEYTYPNAEVAADREFNIVLAADTILSPYLSVNPGVDGAVDEQVYFELGLGHDFAVGESLNIGLSGLTAFLVQPKDSSADDGMSYAAVSTSASYDFITASATYYFETDDDVTTVDTELVGLVGVSYSF